MISARIAGADRPLAEGQDEYHTLWVRTEDFGGVPGMSSLWEPTPAELAVLNAGGGVRLTVLGRGHPPVMLGAEPGGASVSGELGTLSAAHLQALHAACGGDAGTAFVAAMTAAAMAGKLLGLSPEAMRLKLAEVTPAAAELASSLAAAQNATARLDALRKGGGA